MDVQELNVTSEAAIASNPSGLWTGAPALAATTVPMFNTSGHAVWVDVNGGTVTAISINGVATGFTAGSFRVAPNQSLSITYSAAPTVNWYYESVSAVKPSGVWSGAPSLAATTVGMTNTSGQTVNANISGGTFTVVKVNGITLTGIATATTPTVRVRLRRGDVLAITYSSAPTLQWLYE